MDAARLVKGHETLTGAFPNLEEGENAMHHLAKLWLCMAVMIAAAGWARAGMITTDLIDNGDFESGSFLSWNKTNVANGDWFINNGSTSWPVSGIRSPINGNFDAVASQGGPGFHDLWQEFTLPTDITTTTLSWSDRIFNSSSFSDPNQEFRVIIKSLTGTPLLTIFSTNPGDQNPQVGPNNRSFDLTSFAMANAGESFRLSFEEQDNQGNFNVFLDEVHLVSTFETPDAAPVPEPTSIALLGIGAVGMIGVTRRRLRGRRLVGVAA